MIQQLPPELARPGDALTAAFWNRSFDAATRLSAVPNQVIGHPIGGGEEASSRVGVFSLYSGLSADGWMRCVNYQTGTFTNIAAPVEFRKKIWNDHEDAPGDGVRTRHPEIDRTVRYIYGPSLPEFPDEPTYHTTRRIAHVIQTGEKFIEVIKPDYRSRDVRDNPNAGTWDGYPIIVAARTGPDGTGIMAPVDRGEGPVDEPVVWMDLNWAGRQWHMVPTQLLPT